MGNMKQLDAEELQKIYSDVSEWLKFLEAKHATVFAVWTALLIAIVTTDFGTAISVFWKTTAIVACVLGILINLISFIPFLNNCKLLRYLCHKHYLKKTTDNIVFYQSIFVNTYIKKSETETRLDKYEKQLKQRFDYATNNKYLKDYLNQIIDVSTVATVKAYLFQISVSYIMMIALCLILLCVIA